MNLAGSLSRRVVSPPQSLDQRVAICAGKRTVCNFVPYHLNFSLVLNSRRDDFLNGCRKHPQHTRICRPLLSGCEESANRYFLFRRSALSIPNRKARRAWWFARCRVLDVLFPRFEPTWARKPHSWGDEAVAALAFSRAAEDRCRSRKRFVRLSPCHRRASSAKAPTPSSSRRRSQSAVCSHQTRRSVGSVRTKRRAEQHA